MSKILIFVLMLVLIPSVSALQQTAGAINMSVEPGNSVVGKYGVRNDNNVTTTISFTIVGNISEFITYEKNITLSPNEFRYINVTATIPKDYVGNGTKKYTIYALEEGDKGGQVQLNVRLGKYIYLDITEPPMAPKKSGSVPAIMFIGIIFMVYAFVKKNKV